MSEEQHEHDENKEFDGIKQSGNDFPSWYKQIFSWMVVIGLGYTIYFHFISKDWAQDKQFLKEVALHEEKFPPPKMEESADGINPLREDAEAIALGQKTFQNICSACHGLQGQGVVGPSLMDKTWIHGDTDALVYAHIMKGISVEQAKLGRGPMPAHDQSLGTEKVYQVMAWLAKENPSLKAK